MTDVLGPMTAANATTVRPAETRTAGAIQTWFKACSSSVARDGTVIEAAWLNQMVALLGGLGRGNGLRLDGVTPVLAEDLTNDAWLLQSVQHLIQRGTPSRATITGGPSAYLFLLVPSPPELIDGFVFNGKIPVTNSGAATLGGSPILDSRALPLSGGEMVAGQFRTFTWVAAASAWVLGGAQMGGPRSFASFMVAGSAVFTAPFTGLYLAETLGAGGGGAGGNGSVAWSGGGGGAGGWAKGLFLLSAGQTVPIVVGAGGAGGAAPGSNSVGSSGTTTAFGAYMQATGGSGGSGGTASSAGGPGGMGLGGLINMPGAYGGDGNNFSATVQGGAGASSIYGGGGRTSTGGGAPSNGRAPGSGGGGIWGTGSSALVGGNGADGAINIWA